MFKGRWLVGNDLIHVCTPSVKTGIGSNYLWKVQKDVMMLLEIPGIEPPEKGPPDPTGEDEQVRGRVMVPLL